VGVLDFVFELMIPGEFWFGFFGFFQWHNKRHLHLMIIFFVFILGSLCLSVSLSLSAAALILAFILARISHSTLKAGISSEPGPGKPSGKPFTHPLQPYDPNKRTQVLTSEKADLSLDDPKKSKQANLSRHSLSSPWPMHLRSPVNFTP
jgi:hypothetical protein